MKLAAHRMSHIIKHVCYKDPLITGKIDRLCKTCIIDIIGTWCIGIPLCLLAAYVFKWGIVGVYTLLTTEELFRLAVSLIIFKRRNWIVSLC